METHESAVECISFVPACRKIRFIACQCQLLKTWLGSQRFSIVLQTETAMRHHSFMQINQSSPIMCLYSDSSRAPVQSPALMVIHLTCYTLPLQVRHLNHPFLHPQKPLSGCHLSGRGLDYESLFYISQHL